MKDAPGARKKRTTSRRSSSKSSGVERKGATSSASSKGARDSRAAPGTPRDRRTRRPSAPRGGPRVSELQVREIESLRDEVGRRTAELLPRWNADPEDVQRSVAQLVLALVEFLRKLLERQAIRRMEAETLDPEEIERIGLALMRLEETVHDMARRFGLKPEELNLDLGPIGRLI